MSLLESIKKPEDIHALSFEDLKRLCEELREKIISTVSQTGGHLSSNLGVVELTVMLHKLFSVPHDEIVWDVGHQCYAHKLLTGRMERFDTLRKTDGISGFPKPSESNCDAFVAGHSSTSISAANGIAKAKTMVGDDGYVVAVIGDGAMTGGLAYEGLSNAGRSHDRLIVILNDNKMSINQNVGFVARHLATLRSRPLYVRLKSGISGILSNIPLIGKPLYRFVSRVKLRVKITFYRSSCLFEEMGFHYLGPIDGHDLKELGRAIQSAKKLNRPVLLHVLTVKGKGCEFATQNPDVYHGVAGFDVATGETAASGDSFSKAAGACLCQLAEHDPQLCVITAAMTGGTGLTTFAQTYPKRFFDVGIAEGHAVTFLSGLAAGGCLPVFAVYSTFLQRAYDQILNDTAIMNNHIVLAVDRAGIVPDDGETHQGIFDVPFLSTIPNVTIYSPSSYDELAVNMKQALYDEKGIAVVRYPRGKEFPIVPGFKPDYKPYTYLRNADARILVITYGRLFANAVQAVKELQDTMPVSLLKLTKIHPLSDLLFPLISQYPRVIFFEEGSKSGGVAQQLGSFLMEKRYKGRYEIRAIEGFIPTCSVEDGLRLCRLDTDSMVSLIRGDESLGN